MSGIIPLLDAHPIEKLIGANFGWIQIGLTTALCFGCGVTGWHLRDLDYQAYKGKIAEQHLKADKQVSDLEHSSTRAATASRDEGDKKQAEVRVIYQTIKEKVPYYVHDLPVSPGLGISLGAVRLHDYAALGIDPPVPSPSGFDTDAPSGVGVPALLGTVSANYGVCKAYRTEALTWRSWYQNQASLWAASTTTKRKTKAAPTAPSASTPSQ